MLSNAIQLGPIGPSNARIVLNWNTFAATYLPSTHVIVTCDTNQRQDHTALQPGQLGLSRGDTAAIFRHAQPCRFLFAIKIACCQHSKQPAVPSSQLIASHICHSGAPALFSPGSQEHNCLCILYNPKTRTKHRQFASRGQPSGQVMML